MKNCNLYLGILGFALFVSASGPARAAGCTITSAAVVFPNYDVANAAPTTAAPLVQLSCNGNGAATISIGASSVSGSIPSRQMKHATLPDRLNYNLYTSSGYTTVWGTAAGSTYTIASIKTTDTATIYARIPAGQDVSVGSYSDTVTLSITP